MPCRWPTTRWASPCGPTWRLTGPSSTPSLRGTAAEPSLAEAVEAHRLVDAAYRSAASAGRRFRWADACRIGLPCVHRRLSGSLGSEVMDIVGLLQEIFGRVPPLADGAVSGLNPAQLAWAPDAGVQLGRLAGLASHPGPGPSRRRAARVRPALGRRRLGAPVRARARSDEHRIRAHRRGGSLRPSRGLRGPARLPPCGRRTDLGVSQWPDASRPGAGGGPAMDAAGDPGCAAGQCGGRLLPARRTGGLRPGPPSSGLISPQQPAPLTCSRRGR